MTHPARSPILRPGILPPSRANGHLGRKDRTIVYAKIFRQLPGPLWARILTSLLLLFAVVLLLMEFVFPWVSTVSPWTDSTVGAD